MAPGAILAAIRKEIEEARIFKQHKQRSGRRFHQQPGPILMKRYDQASKEKRRMLTQNEVKSEIKHLGIEMPMRKGRMLDKKLDAKRCEKQIRKLLIRDR